MSCYIFYVAVIFIYIFYIHVPVASMQTVYVIKLSRNELTWIGSEHLGHRFFKIQFFTT